MTDSTHHMASDDASFSPPLDARIHAMASEVVEAADAMATARAASERAMAEQEIAERASDARAMSGNVRLCPVPKANRLPRPPQLPEDPTEAELIVAAEDARLSPAQRIAIAALVCGQTAIVAARRAGVTPRTIHRWQQEPAFNETLNRLSDETMNAASRRVRNLLLRGTHVIADALHGSDQYRWAMRVVGSSQVWKMSQRPRVDAPTSTSDKV
jgi:hypothetical protein